MLRYATIFGVLALILAAAVGSRLPAPEESPALFVRRVENIMATPIAVEAPADRAAEANAIVFDTFHEVDTMMSEWKPGSPLAAVNDRAGISAVVVPAALLGVIERGLELGRLTDGAFDITWAALWGTWDFRAEPPHLPADREIERRLPLIDAALVRVDHHASTVELPLEGMTIGLGGIAKGTALNLARDRLLARGIDRFILTAGGQVLVHGRPGDRPWRVGVRDPRGAADELFATIELNGLSLATSGDYERYFVIDGVRYHHILDPRTGWPSHDVRSATVIAADAELADGLSTALMILGPDAGMALIERLDGVEALVIDASGTPHQSTGIKQSLVFLRPINSS